MNKLTALLLASALGLAACAPAGDVVFVPQGSGVGTGVGTGAGGTAAGISVSGAAQPRGFARPSPPAAEADAFAAAFLDSIQGISFAERREFCGYFLVDSAGRISATPPVRGTLASCTQPGPGPAVFASYHTHGAYDPRYDNEVPSPEDLLGDFSFGIEEQ